MVGRAGELARLLAHVDRAVAGGASAVLLAGDAGVGKTRLLDELATRAAERGARVLIGHCVDLGDVGLPYLPFVDLLRPVAADPDLAPAAAGNPVLAGLLAGRTSTPVPRDDGDLGRPLQNRAAPQPVEDGRLQLFESVAGLLCELAATGPLLVVLEDVHWADRSSRDLLRYLLARLVDEPVVVVASYRVRRPAPPSSAASAARRAGAAARRRAAGARARCRTPTSASWSAAWPPGGAAREHRRRRRRPGGGERVLRRGAARRRPARRGAAARADRRPAGPRGAALAGRPAGAPGRRGRRAAGAARAGGRRRRAGAGELEQALAEAVHHHLLVVSDDGRYRFRHALLREAVLADLLPGERVRLHARDRRLPGGGARRAGRRPSGRTTPAGATTCPAR